MKMKLYASPSSPYVRKVRVLFHEARQADAYDIIPPQADNTDMSHVYGANPLGRLPTLVCADGTSLYDSRVICLYLDGLYDAGLYPQDRLFEVLKLEATGDGILDSALAMIYETRFHPPEKVHEPWIERHWDKVTRALDHLEQSCGAHLSAPLDAGQIAVGCALGYLDFRHGARDWRQGRPALSSWFAALCARPSMEATAHA